MFGKSRSLFFRLNSTGSKNYFLLSYSLRLDCFYCYFVIGQNLFIHFQILIFLLDWAGNMQAFVPPFMLDELYESAGAPKRRMLVEGAGHGQSPIVDRQNYWYNIFDFLENT